MGSDRFINYTDLHCDTVSRASKEGKSLYDGDLQINLQKAKNIEKYEQYFALWLSDEPRGETAFSLCKNMLSCYERQMRELKARGITNLIPHLSIENASALGGKIDNVGYFKSRGVEIMSLTWNGENGLASGVNAKGGLKSFGRQVVREMARLDMTLDVSHLNERGFYEVHLIDSIKTVATHSNCYDVHPHRRNLKKWQVRELISRGGLIGLNFYPLFLGTGQVDAFGKIKANIEYLLSFGGENNIAFGSDFDGAEMSPELDGIDKVRNLYEYLISSGLSERVAEKIFYRNCENFTA